MSYLTHAQDPRRRATAIGIAAAVHAVLAVGLVTGLGVTIERIVEPRLVGTNVKLDPPKPEPSPSPTPTREQVTYIPPAPVPPIPLPPAPGPSYKPFDGTSDPVVILDPRPPMPPSPGPASFTPKRAVPSNGSSGWISNSDYPRRPLVEGIEGTVSYRLVIGTNGRVSSCELTRPSGNRALDEATCRLIASRARFEPATDENGAKVLGTFSGSVRWQIPD